VGLSEDLDAIAAAAGTFADDGEELAAVIPAEPAPGQRVYLCAFTSGGDRSWLALDGDGMPVVDLDALRSAVSIAALCELAEESAAGGKPEELRAQLDEIAAVEGRALVAEAETALRALYEAIEPPPRLASAAYLDRIGTSTRALEQALGEIVTSPFAEAMKHGAVAVEGLTAEVEGAYKLPLAGASPGSGADAR
jgi:hypothetical protein